MNLIVFIFHNTISSLEFVGLQLQQLLAHMIGTITLREKL